MDTITQVISILQKLFIAGGIGVAIYNLFVFGSNLKDHNGPEMKNALLGILGGAVIIACGALVGQIDLNF